MRKNLKNKIIFLGTGGGASMVSLQKLSTAGAWINIEGVNLFLDPGPGAIWKLREAHLDPNILEGILVTHRHLDHTGDLNALVEAIFYQVKPAYSKRKTRWRYKQDFFVLVPPDILKDGLIFPFHRSLPKHLITLKERTSYKIKNLKITTTRDLLEKPWRKNDNLKFKEFGFTIHSGQLGIAFIPETFYEEGLFKAIKAKILILNVMRPFGEELEMLVKTILAIKPEVVVLNHYVKRSFFFGPAKIAKVLEKKTEIKTLAAKDGDVFDLKKKKFIQ